MNKLKQLLVLVSILGTYSYATCTKQEVMKLIDKGFSKAEISSICDISSKIKHSLSKTLSCKYETKIRDCLSSEIAFASM